MAKRLIVPKSWIQNSEQQNADAEYFKKAHSDSMAAAEEKHKEVMGGFAMIQSGLKR